MERQREEQRREVRVPTALKVKLDDERTGTARDVSASGIYLEMEGAVAQGTRISFKINFDTPGGTLVLSCEGEVVRVERKDARLGVGVKILDSRLQPAEAAGSAPALT